MGREQKALWRTKLTSASDDEDPVDGIRYLAIDLLQDDQEIIQAFKIWLRKQRRHEGYHREPLGEKDFRQWHQYKILQVFDLALWSYINGPKFTNEFIRATLWPNLDLAPAERIRKTIHPKVEEIISPTTLLRLKKDKSK